MAFVDKTVNCQDCSEDFIFTAGEQEFYAEKGLLNEPRRCPACRSLRRQGRAGSAGRVLHPVVCANCGEETTVPFFPRQDRPVYCRNCFEKTRATSF